jgi:hypothetical protein
MLCEAEGGAMNRVFGMLFQAVLILTSIVVAAEMLNLAAAAQTTSTSARKRTSPPAGWQEKWVGMYEGQDRQGKNAPPGFKVEYPPEPDTIELIDSVTQPWAKARREETVWNIEDSALCRPQGTVRKDSSLDFQIAVSPEKITLIGGRGGSIYLGGSRRIYMNRPHLKNPPYTYLGDWVGHWEGETLVADGIGFNEKTWFTRDRQRHTEALHIVERWRFVSNDEWIEMTATIDDRFALTAPFTVTRYYRKLPNHTAPDEGVCLDTPEGRRAWVKLFKQSLEDWDEERKTLGTKE